MVETSNDGTCTLLSKIVWLVDDRRAIFNAFAKDGGTYRHDTSLCRCIDVEDIDLDVFHMQN